MMVEVFKTNVKNKEQANLLIQRIHQIFVGYKVNFDLEDCDKIMRVKSAIGFVQSSCLINLLKEAGYHAEILQDEIYPLITSNY